MTGPRRLGTRRLWITLGALVAVIALALPATSLARLNHSVSSDGQPLSAMGNGAPFPSVTATPTVVGIMGVSSRGAAAAPAAPQATVCPSGAPLQGVDVSVYQAAVNWSMVKQSGRAFAYARAADGTTYLDPTFQTNYAGIKTAGMKAGAYLFFRPSQDPTAQANVLVSVLRQAHVAPGDLAPVFDVELTESQAPATIAAKLHTAINVVQGSLGVTPVIYTSPGFWNPSVGATTFGADPLWVANWNVLCPGVPTGWSTWALWQFNDTSSVLGISGPVDGDESFGPTLPVFIQVTQLTPKAMLPVVVNQAP